jgi:hypothetical protein
LWFRSNSQSIWVLLEDEAMRVVVCVCLEECVSNTSPTKNTCCWRTNNGQYWGVLSCLWCPHRLTIVVSYIPTIHMHLSTDLVSTKMHSHTHLPTHLLTHLSLTFLTYLPRMLTPLNITWATYIPRGTQPWSGSCC